MPFQNVPPQLEEIGLRRPADSAVYAGGLLMLQLARKHVGEHVMLSVYAFLLCKHHYMSRQKLWRTVLPKTTPLEQQHEMLNNTATLIGIANGCEVKAVKLTRKRERKKEKR